MRWYLKTKKPTFAFSSKALSRTCGFRILAAALLLAAFFALITAWVEERSNSCKGSSADIELALEEKATPSAWVANQKLLSASGDCKQTTVLVLAALVVLTAASFQEVFDWGCPFDAATRAAWEKAGSLFGWMGRNQFGALRFLKEPRGLLNCVPAFSVLVWKPGVLERLPDPNAPFGLDLSATHVTDADLKELVRFKNLRSLDLWFTAVTGEGLRELSGLKGLQMLDLSQSKATDEGLKALASIQGLRFLDLRKTAVTDAGAVEIANLENLQWLYLSKTKVGDEALKKLSGLGNLRSLWLNRTKVSDLGVRELARLEHLQWLVLSETKVTDDSIRELTRLKNLRVLRLSFTKVADASVIELAKLERLQRLDLSATDITDAGLKELSRLKSLRMLEIWHTYVTKEAVASLKKALPACKIMGPDL